MRKLDKIKKHVLKKKAKKAGDTNGGYLNNNHDGFVDKLLHISNHTAGNALWITWIIAEIHIKKPHHSKKNAKGQGVIHRLWKKLCVILMYSKFMCKSSTRYPHSHVYL